MQGLRMPSPRRLSSSSSRVCRGCTREIDPRPIEVPARVQAQFRELQRQGSVSRLDLLIRADQPEPDLRLLRHAERKRARQAAHFCFGGCSHLEHSMVLQDPAVSNTDSVLSGMCWLDVSISSV